MLKLALVLSSLSLTLLSTSAFTSPAFLPLTPLPRLSRSVRFSDTPGKDSLPVEPEKKEEKKGEFKPLKPIVAAARTYAFDGDIKAFNKVRCSTFFNSIKQEPVDDSFRRCHVMLTTATFFEAFLCSFRPSSAAVAITTTNSLPPFFPFQFRGKVIKVHSEVIGNFVESSASAFGKEAMTALYIAADKNDDGFLEMDELTGLLKRSGFKWLKPEEIMKRLVQLVQLREIHHALLVPLLALLLFIRHLFLLLVRSAEAVPAFRIQSRQS